MSSTLQDAHTVDSSAILNAPVRHMLMMGIIWYLNQQYSNRDVMEILEVGSWQGASALSFAHGCAQYHPGKARITCVDAWEPYVDRSVNQATLYRDMETALASGKAHQQFLANIEHAPASVEVIECKGRSAELLPKFPHQKMDIVFIDGDHAYDNVKQDIAMAMPLVKEGGILCGDDLNLQLHECDKTHAKAHAAYDLARDPHTGGNYHPGVTLAVAECMGQVSSWAGFWAMQRTVNSWSPISLRGMPCVLPPHFPTDAKQRALAHWNDIQPLW